VNFKVDENLPAREAAQLLEDAGHDAQTVFDEDLQGRPDWAVARRCQQENRILVTLDRGFANLRSYPPLNFPGFLVLRPRWQDKNHVLDLLGRTIPMLSEEPIEHHLWIVEDTRIRIRPAEPT
jgi:predicted nuclease of predicted toxin-antitoxin system